MAIESIQEKILQDARKEADKIREDAQKEVETILKRAETEVEAIKTEGIEAIQREVEERKNRLLSMNNLEFRKDILQEKQRVIEEVFKKSISMIMEIKREDSQRLIKGVLLRVVEKGDEEVIFAPSTLSLLGDDFLAGVNTELKETGRKGELTALSKNCKLDSGFILRRERMEINCSFESIINAIREDLEMDIARVLFGD